MGPAQKVAYGAQFIRQVFQYHRIGRTQNPQLIPKLLRFGAERMKILRRRSGFGTCERLASAFVGLLHRATKLLAIQLIDGPLVDLIAYALKHWNRLCLPIGECRDEICQLQRQHFLDSPIAAMLLPPSQSL